MAITGLILQGRKITAKRFEVEFADVTTPSANAVEGSELVI
jgi:hypothetical protein